MVQLEVPSPLLPEFLGVLGIDVFLLLSMLTCLFDFPVVLQYVYHISAFAGFGQLWVNYVFAFNGEMRFLMFLVYLVIGLANIVFINGYLGFRDRRILWTTSFLCAITIPLLLISFSAVSIYVNKVAISLPLLPLIPTDAIAAILVMCATVLAISLIFQWRGEPHSSRFQDMRGGEEVNENKK